MTTPEKTSARPSKAPRVNLKDLKKLIDMMRKAELSEVNIEQEGLKIALRKDEKPVLAAPIMQLPMAAPVAVASAVPAAPAPVAAPAAPVAAPAPAAAAAEGQVVHSPMVGTIYRSPSPDAPSFVKEGQAVEVGQTVCIIEAMKLMNEIKAESAGTLVKFLVDNASAVEFGQPIYILK